MILYKYDEETKEYLGYFEAYTDPLESIKQNKDVYVIPPCSTPLTPPELKEGYALVFNTEKNIWEELEDHRGLICWDKNGKEVLITDLGSIPEDLLLEKPYTLKETKDEKLEEINSKYSAAYADKVKVEGVKVCIDGAVEIKNKLNAFEEFGNFTFDDVVLSKEEAEKIIKFLYIRSILLLNKKKELLNVLENSKSVEEVKGLKVDFTLKMKKYLDLSIEELKEKLGN